MGIRWLGVPASLARGMGALAEADLGIAMGSGTDIATKEASVILLDSDVQKMPQIFDLARKTMNIVQQNFF
jgi:cation transport ATPase